MSQRYAVFSFFKIFSLLTVLITASAPVLLAQYADIDRSQLIVMDDMIIGPPPAAEEVCTLDPTNTDAHYFIRHEDMAAKWTAESRTADFEIDYQSACGDQQWPQEARNAFEYALDIWASHLNSTIPIRIEATWASLEGNTLGSAGPTRVISLLGAEPDTWYSVAQASAMTGEDIVGDRIEDEDYDIVINMNCEYANWYFGTDAQTPPGRVDFVTVVLHEVGHGIGFIGSMDGDEDEETASHGLGEQNFPFIFDRFAVDGDDESLLNENTYPNPSDDLYQALTGQRGGVFATGQEAVTANEGERVPLFAPDPWNSGSSFSHLDQATYTQTPNALMRPSIEGAFAIHSPGPVFCGMMYDWGWPLGAGCLEQIGVEALIAFSETELDFGVTNVGDFVERTFVISSDEESEDPLNYSISIEDENFTIVPSSDATGRLDPGESRTITVRYNPFDDRIHDTELRISHNAMNEGSPYEIALLGESLREDEIARLEQNYPNPFNPVTTIPYILPETSQVRLDVYNINGQRVRTLVDEQQPEGRYEVSLDGSNLSSGVYLYRLIVGDFMDVKKLMLVK
jgi:hypothetical protein